MSPVICSCRCPFSGGGKRDHRIVVGLLVLFFSFHFGNTFFKFIFVNKFRNQSKIFLYSMMPHISRISMVVGGASSTHSVCRNVRTPAEELPR